MIAARIAMRRKQAELKRAAKIAAENGMFDSASALRNQAKGLKMAIEILEEDARILTEVECLARR